MTYKITTKALIQNLKVILLLDFIAIILLLLYADNPMIIIGIGIITLALIIPQIYLLIQYKKATNFISFKIDYKNELFTINNSNNIIKEDFSKLKTIQYNKATIPFSYLSLAFTLCEYFYYYKLEFIDGSVYYLTSLLSPNLIIEEKGVFYPYFIKINRKYATIKR